MSQELVKLHDCPHHHGEQVSMRHCKSSHEAAKKQNDEYSNCLKCKIVLSGYLTSNGSKKEEAERECIVCGNKKPPGDCYKDRRSCKKCHNDKRKKEWAEKNNLKGFIAIGTNPLCALDTLTAIPGACSVGSTLLNTVSAF